MRFDLHLRAAVNQQIGALAEKMKDWEIHPQLQAEEEKRLLDAITLFAHTIRCEPFCLGGVDGSGDFPSVGYADSFVYVSVAHGTVYASDPTSGLREQGPLPDPLIHFTWLPEEEAARHKALDEAFAYLAGRSVAEVVEASDYRQLKKAESRRSPSVGVLIEKLIRPHAADAGNLGLQLRSTAELGAALRLIRNQAGLKYVLIDGTLSLPMVGHIDSSLFYEHLKRLCCVEARTRGVGLLALSKSHGLPAIELIEGLARQKTGVAKDGIAEHWYVRLPTPSIEGWEFSLVQGRRIPPPGAVTYLVRFHRNTPVMRLDLDRAYWQSHIRGATEAATHANERRIFEDLDYASHDQRCYGYPYPIKAGHDRASLSAAERAVLRKQIIDAAVQAGMKRALFREASALTGHE